jgi:hypothetical protein
MELPWKRHRLRKIEKLLHNQLHEAEEKSCVAEIRQLPKFERDRASMALKLALPRWRVFVTKATLLDDLKRWDCTGLPPAPGANDLLVTTHTPGCFN